MKLQGLVTAAVLAHAFRVELDERIGCGQNASGAALDGVDAARDVDDRERRIGSCRG